MSIERVWRTPDGCLFDDADEALEHFNQTSVERIRDEILIQSIVMQNDDLIDWILTHYELTKRSED